MNGHLTRIHLDGCGGHAGTDGIVVEDRHCVFLATFQGADRAVVLVDNVAAEEAILCVYEGGRERGHVWLTLPCNQSSVGLTVQGGSDVVRWTCG